MIYLSIGIIGIIISIYEFRTTKKEKGLKEKLLHHASALLLAYSILVIVFSTFVLTGTIDPADTDTWMPF